MLFRDSELPETGWLLLNDDPSLLMMDVILVWPGDDPDQHPVRGGVGGDTGVVTWRHAALINEIQILFYVKSVKQNEISHWM